MAGYLSDRTDTRIGRRRPWMAASVIPIGAVFVMMWSPPGSLTGAGLVAWMAVGVLGFYTAMTVFIVPHTALGAELTDAYHDRTRVFATRHVVWTLGSLSAVGGMQLLINAEQPRDLATVLGWSVALVTGALILWTVRSLRERSEFRGRGGQNPLASFRDVWRNPHARLLLIVFLIENLGAATIGLLTFYVAKYVVMRPDLTGIFILLYMVASIGFVPIWLPLSRRFGKKQLWIFSMLLTGVAFGGMFFLRENSIFLISILAFLAGIAASCGAMVGPSIQADVIDYDEYMTGERKEGAYFAAWNFVFKSATGVTIMLSGWVLQVVGFIPNQEQTEAVKLAILSLYSIFPLVCYAIGTALFVTFKLDEAEHSRIRRILDERATGG
jgi:GPH family glycoside/pentoside/hexuronide:cation symporter